MSPTYLFGPQGHPLWWQECARAALIFAYGLALVRIAGRRVFGKWSALDIIVSVIVGSNLSRALTGSAPLFGTLAATTLLMALHWVLAQGRRAPAGSPTWSRATRSSWRGMGRPGATPCGVTPSASPISTRPFANPASSGSPTPG